MQYEKEKKAKIPQSLTVRIHLKWIDNIQNAKLEINETTLLFEYPDLYYLDLNLKYKVDESRSKAKFDKSKSQLNLTIPIIGIPKELQDQLDAKQKEIMDNKARIESLEEHQEKPADKKDEAPSEPVEEAPEIKVTE